jgi:hypothetical protein
MRARRARRPPKIGTDVAAAEAFSVATRLSMSAGCAEKPHLFDVAISRQFSLCCTIATLFELKFLVAKLQQVFPENRSTDRSKYE